MPIGLFRHSGNESKLECACKKLRNLRAPYKSGTTKNRLGCEPILYLVITKFYFSIKVHIIEKMVVLEKK